MTYTDNIEIIIEENSIINNIESTNIEVVIEEAFITNEGVNPNYLDSIYTAGEAIGGHKIVYILANSAMLADIDNINCVGKIIGMTTHAANAGQDIRIRRSGEIISSGWGLSPNALYYLGNNGEINTSQGNGLYTQLIGFASASNKIEININIPVLR